MSFDSPIDEQEDHEHEADHAGALHDANGIGRPRTFSASAQKMWPPSSGRNGNRLTIASDSEMIARTLSALAAVERRSPGA